MPQNEIPSWLWSQNSEWPMIFRVTGANQNVQKLLFTDIVNTKLNYTKGTQIGYPPRLSQVRSSRVENKSQDLYFVPGQLFGIASGSI